MNLKYNFTRIFCVFLFCSDVALTLPCLTAKSKKDFDATRSALKSLETFLKGQIDSSKSKVKALETFLQGQVSSINTKIQTLDKDIEKMEGDFKRRQWRKYKDHCYFFGTDLLPWTTAERKCREIGGYLTKIDDSSENNWIFDQTKKSSVKSNWWIGMTDVVNGDFRWIYDQSKPSYKNFYGSQPYSTSNKLSYTNNCMALLAYSGYKGKWHEYSCSNSRYYVCESNFCFS